MRTLKYQSVYDADTSIDELALLSKTAGAAVCKKFVAHISKINPKTFIGEGKVTEVKEYIETLEEKDKPDVVIFDEELTGMQFRNLEELFGIPVIDRTQLILDIFAMRAKTQEAMLEVELAQLEYLLPRLIGMGKILSRLGGGIGTRGPGETKLEADRRKIRAKISRIKKDLEETKKDRTLHRSLRSEFPYPQVSLVGYTNAGKSTLLNAMAHSEVYVKDQLFSTLTTTTKKVKLPGSALEVLVTDTVGFINKIPHKLVMSFRATLEETVHADLLLHVVDGSNPEHREQIEAVNIVLKEIECHEKPVVLVFNKTDKGCLVNPDDFKDIACVAISAKDKTNFNGLHKIIEDHFTPFIEEYELCIPCSDGKTISFIKGYSRVLEEIPSDESIRFKIRMYKRHKNLIEKYLIA